LIAKERQRGIKYEEKIGEQEEEKKLNFLIARRKFSLSIFVKHRETFFFCVASLLNIKLQSSSLMEREEHKKNFHFSFIVILVAVAAGFFMNMLYVRNKTYKISICFGNKGFS